MGEQPDDVLNRMRALESERDDLKKALGARPNAEATLRLEHLEAQKELWESDRTELSRELAEARNEATRKRIAVTELESLRDEKDSLKSASELLREANKQLRAEVDELIKGVEGKSPFPSCTSMDSERSLQESTKTLNSAPCLKTLAADVRQQMAWDPQGKKNLYYSERDVRSFLGGLAMSRLHLLQGISGTGKTSLPLAFARAIGAGNSLIEVQAGWRDRQDLVGHYNSFEKRFYESEFLQALYRASTPRYADKPFIVVLDEMNLSHPEQYFADMLSALEQDQERQRLILMSAAVDPAPEHLKDGGKELPIPPNVWFVGTANHDETTKDFADKTYDRAHVMELPRNREQFEAKEPKRQDSISQHMLQQAFEQAATKHKKRALDAYNFIQKELGNTLERRFHLGWGNRLERQMNAYVPVIVAAGGTIGEATDHILATKLLRKIRGRHDNRPEDLIELERILSERWSELGGSSSEAQGPTRSMNMVKRELRRLGHEDD